MTPSKTCRVYKPLAFENKHGHLPKAGSQLLLPATTLSTPGRTLQEHSEGSTGTRTPPGAALKLALPAHSPPALPSPQRGASDGVSDPHTFTLRSLAHGHSHVQVSWRGGREGQPRTPNPFPSPAVAHEARRSTATARSQHFAPFSRALPTRRIKIAFLSPRLSSQRFRSLRSGHRND